MKAKFIGEEDSILCFYREYKGILMKRFIDYNKCDGCDGKFPCVHDCVTSFLEISYVEGRQCADFRKRGFCIDCGHCNAICPKKAILCSEENDLLNDELLNLFAMKRTVRNYTSDREISKAEIDYIIKAAQSAPTEKNRGTVRICLIKEQLESIFLEALEILKNRVEKIGSIHPQYKLIMDLYEKKQPIFWGAEYAVIIIGNPEFIIDAALAAERMQLMAWAHGISSGYNGNLKMAINSSDSLKEKLAIKKKEEVLVCFALGYSSLVYHSPYISEKKIVQFM